MCAAEYSKCYVSLKERRAISNGKIERTDNSSYLYGPFCLQKTVTYTLVLNPHNSPVGGNIVTSLFYMGEIKIQRG